MVTVNGRAVDWKRGEKIEEVVKRADACHAFMIVCIDGKCLRKEEWAKMEVNDGDEISTMQIIAGG